MTEHQALDGAARVRRDVEGMGGEGHPLSQARHVLLTSLFLVPPATTAAPGMSVHGALGGPRQHLLEKSEVVGAMTERSEVMGVMTERSETVCVMTERSETMNQPDPP